MNRLILTILCAFIFVKVNAQTTEQDSLQKILANTKEDTSRMWVLIKLAREFESSRPDTAMLYARRALQLAQNIHSEKGEAKSLEEIAYLLMVTGNYPKALETVFKSLQINEKMNDQRGIAVSYNTIGIIYNEQGDFRQALDYFYKSKMIMENLKDGKSIVIRIENIADVYEKMNLLDSALLFEERAYKMRFEIHDMYEIHITLLNLGNIHSKLGHTSEALNYYRESISFCLEEEDIDGLSEIYLGLANLFKRSGPTDSVFFYARLAFEKAQSVLGYKKMMLSSEFLANTYEAEKNIDSSFRYFKIAMAAKDTLFSEEKINEVQNLRFNEQLRQQEIAEEKAKAAKERRNNLQMMAIAVFILGFFSSVLIVSHRKTNSQLLEFLGLLALLLIFEFIALFLHPYIADWTNHTPVFMLLMLVAVASVLVPLHHRLESWTKRKLAKRQTAIVK